MKKSTLLTIAAVTLVVIGGTYLRLRPNDGDGRDREKEQTSPTRPAQWTGPLPREVAEEFLKAETTAERLKWVRNPARVAPLVEAFYGEGPGAREQVVELKPRGPMRTSKITFQRFQAILENGSSRLVAVMVTEEGASVDFECYARHGSESWPDLLSGEATEAEVVRLAVKPGAYYNYAFSDDKIWRSLVAISLDLEKPFFVYVRRGSEEAKQLAKIGAQNPTRFTVAIRALEGSHQHRQFEVKKVHGPGWVMTDPGETPEDVPES